MFYAEYLSRRCVWRFERNSGITFPQAIRKLHRLAQRFIGQGTVEEVVDALVTKKLIQILPPATATYVRRSNPRIAGEAARLAEYFFQNNFIEILYCVVSIHK